MTLTSRKSLGSLRTLAGVLTLLTAAVAVSAAPASARAVPGLHLGAIVPGAQPVLQVPTRVNLVFVGYQPSAINLRHLLAGLPASGDPIVRYPAFRGIQQDVGLRYHYQYVPRFASNAFDNAFFNYLSTAGFTGPVDPIVDTYNHETHHALTVGPTVRYIDAASTESWLERNAASRLGIDRGEDTVYLVNWYGHPGFQFHEFTEFGYVDPDTGVDAGNDFLAAVRAWGGHSGPTWFLDLSANPVWWDNSYDMETADFDNNGQIEYRLPPIWDYGTTAYRPFNDLSGDLALAVRYVADDMMFGASPIYDPAASVPSPGGAKQIALDVFEGDPATNGLSDLHPDVVLANHRALEPFYPIQLTVHDQPVTPAVQNVLDIVGSFSPGPGCWNAYGDPFAETYCEFIGNYSRYFPPSGANAVIPAVGFTVPVLPPAYGFIGSTDDDWQSGKPSLIEMMDTPRTRESFYAIAYTETLTHEAGHFVGLSHPHDGYDSSTGVDFNVEGPTDIAWMGDDSATVMSYLPGVHSFDVFDRDNLARWQVARLLALADTDSAAVLARRLNVQADALLLRADAEFTEALAAMHSSQWITAATHAVAGYRDVQLADAAAGVTPASQKFAAAQAARLASGGADDDSPDALANPTRPMPKTLPGPIPLTQLPPETH